MKQTPEVSGYREGEILNRLPRNLQIKLLYLFNEADEWLPRLKRKDLWRPLVVGALALQMAACKPTVGYENPNTSSPPAITEIYQPPQPPFPTLEPTLTPTPEPTSTPTLEPTPTNTPIPTLSPERVGGVEGIPDPKETNPELFNLKNYAPIPQFVRAMEMGGIEVDPQEVVDNLQYQPIKGVDGEQYIIGTYYLDPNPNQSGETLEGPIPLLIWSEEGWRDIKRELADLGGINFGVQGLSEAYNDREYKKRLKYFNQIVIDGELHWGGTIVSNKKLRPSADRFNFTWADKVVNLAEYNNMKIQAHHLVWGINFPGPDGRMITAIPDWLSQGDYTREQLIQIMQDHIYTVMRHYPNINSWTVVNEPYTYSRGADFWFERLGDQYIEIAFETASQIAQETNLSILLILNDTDNLTINQRSNFGYKKLRALSQRGIPNLAYGFQAHIDGANPPSVEQMIRNFQRFKDLGVEIVLTELDVDMSNVRGTPEEKAIIQAQIYRNVIEAFLEAGGTDFSIFGVSDDLSWYEFTGKPDANATLRDDHGRLKPAYYTIQQILFKRLLNR